jgi:hypothetical protein
MNTEKRESPMRKTKNPSARLVDNLMRVKKMQSTELPRSGLWPLTKTLRLIRKLDSMMRTNAREWESLS